MSELKRTFTPEEIIRLLGWTNEQAAKKLGCSHATIVRRKHGESPWKVPEIYLLSQASEIPVERIVFNCK